MKTNILFYILVSLFSIHLKANESIQLYNSNNKIIDFAEEQITYDQWELFCDIMSYIRDTDFTTYAKCINPKKYQSSNPKVYIKLDKEDSHFYNKWLTKHGKDKNYLKQVLEEIENCLPPTSSSVSTLCSDLMTPEQVTSENSIGYNYQNALWELAGAKPKIDPTEVGRVKVKRYWNKYKKDIRCPATGRRDTDDLNVAKHALDTSGIRFTRELAIAYKVDFNFVDEKDGLTVLDFVQKRIDQSNQQIPKPEPLILEYQAVYDAIVRAGGKHKKDLKPEEY